MLLNLPDVNPEPSDNERSDGANSDIDIRKRYQDLEMKKIDVKD